VKRALLDEGVPKPLATLLRELGVDATAFPNAWKQLSNGKLLDAVEQQGFQVLITNDKNMPYQQDLAKRRIAVLVLPTNHLRSVLAMAENIARSIEAVEIGTSSLLANSGHLPGRHSPK
jgi:hypothetical protein